MQLCRILTCLLLCNPFSSVTGVSVISPTSLDLRRAAAGGMAGAIANGLLHPLDTVKTVRQRNPTQFQGTFRTMRSIISKQGLGGLYGGIGPAVIGAVPSSALFWGTYEKMRSVLTRLDIESQISSGDVDAATARLRFRPQIHCISAASGNAVSSMIFVPKEMLKQRLQAARASGSGHNLVGIAREVLQREGLKGFYSAYSATLARNIPTTVLNFLIYEELRLTVNRHLGGQKKIQGRSLWCGAISGATASAIMTPVDVVKTRIATGMLDSKLGVSGALLKLAAEEGKKGLFAGCKARMLGAALFSSVGFTAYEYCKLFFGCQTNYTDLTPNTK